jgi:hypothetical protein
MEAGTKERLEKDFEQIKTLTRVLEEESEVKGSDKLEEKIASLIEKNESTGSEEEQELAKVYERFNTPLVEIIPRLVHCLSPTSTLLRVLLLQ